MLAPPCASMSCILYSSVFYLVLHETGDIHAKLSLPGSKDVELAKLKFALFADV